MKCSLCKEYLAGKDQFVVRNIDTTFKKIDHYWLCDFETVKPIIYKSKFSKEFSHLRHCAKHCAEIYAQQFGGLNDFLVTNVPTRQSHIKSRGFDHSEIFAKTFAKTIRAKYSPLFFQATSFTQTGATKGQRSKNPKYVLAQLPKQSKILIIDDVATTTSSIRHCAETLLQNNQYEVSVLTLAYRQFRSQ